MQLSLLYRLAIPLLLAVVSATVFFRFMLLVLVGLVVTGFLVLLRRAGGKVPGRVTRTDKAGKRVIDGTYRVVDDEHRPTG